MKKFKYLLLFMVATFMSVTSAQAEECINLINNTDFSFVGANSSSYWTYYSADSPVSISLEKDKTYTFWINDGSQPFSYYLNSIIISKILRFSFDDIHIYDFSVNSFTFTPSKSISIPLLIYHTGSYGFTVKYQPMNENFSEFWLVESDKICSTITTDDTLDNFYTIFISKLQLLSQYGIENKFVLASISIIILFIILEIILNLFERGGYH